MSTFITHSYHGVKNSANALLRSYLSNHGAFTKQHEVLLNLVSDISVNVSEISDKVNKLLVERKLIGTQKSVNNNEEVLNNVIVDLEMLKKTMNTIKQRQNKSMKHEKYEERLKTAISKLKEHVFYCIVLYYEALY